MNKIVREPDGSWCWDCPIDRDFHRRSGRSGLLWILILCDGVFITFLIASHGKGIQNDIWIPLLVIGVILVTALPLFLLWNSAEEPCERYVMTEDHVTSGYGRGTICSVFKKTKEVRITSKYIELTGNYRSNRIYVPPEDMDFVREFILRRLPDDAEIRYTDPRQ